MNKKLAAAAAAVSVFVSATAFGADNAAITNTNLKLTKNTSRAAIEINIPQFQIDALDDYTDNVLYEGIGDINRWSASANPEKVQLDIYYDYSMNGSLLSLWITAYQDTGGAHGMFSLQSITYDTADNKFYTLEGLFKPYANYKGRLTQIINTAVSEDMEDYFPEASETIEKCNGNFNFYIDGNQLVIYFNEYEIAPFASGIREFSIDCEALRDILAPAVFRSMKDAEPLGNIRLDGQSASFSSPCYETNGTLMLPLRETAELLGNKTDWDKEKGAMLNGIPIKGKTAYELKNGVTYVPVSYFNDYSKDTVYCGNGILRLFTGRQINSLKYKQMLDFVSPESGLDCVEKYAKAYQEGNMTLQRGLLAKNLRIKENIRTGLSNPIIQDFDISELSSSSYRIIFHWGYYGQEYEETTEMTVSVGRDTSSENYKITALRQK